MYVFQLVRYYGTLMPVMFVAVLLLALAGQLTAFANGMDSSLLLLRVRVPRSALINSEVHKENGLCTSSLFFLPAWQTLESTPVRMRISSHYSTVSVCVVCCIVLCVSVSVHQCVCASVCLCVICCNITESHGPIVATLQALVKAVVKLSMTTIPFIYNFQKSSFEIFCRSRCFAQMPSFALLTCPFSLSHQVPHGESAWVIDR